MGWKLKRVTHCAHLIVNEGRKRHAEQANAFRGREQRLQQRLRDSVEIVHRGDRRCGRHASRNDLKISIVDLQRHRSPVETFCLPTTPDLGGERRDLGASSRSVGDVDHERILSPDRAPRSVRLDGPMVDAAGDVVIPSPDFPKCSCR